MLSVQASLWDLTHLKEKKCCVSRAYAVWPQIFGKTPLLLKKKVYRHILPYYMALEPPLESTTLVQIFTD